MPQLDLPQKPIFPHLVLRLLLQLLYQAVQELRGLASVLGIVQVNGIPWDMTGEINLLWHLLKQCHGNPRLVHCTQDLLLATDKH